MSAFWILQLEAVKEADEEIVIELALSTLPLIYIPELLPDIVPVF